MLRAPGLVLALALGPGCVSTVVPPEPPADPATVLLLTHGRHAGLLLPASLRPGLDAGFVEYGYGDWTWYALGHADCWRAPGTVLWPNRGALGRRVVEADELAGDPYPGATLTPLTVSLARADALLARLDAEFEASSERRFNAEYGMEFARHPARFWLFHTCADEVAEWLEELDCDVSWSPIRTRLSVPDD